MYVIEPERVENLVRADSVKARNGFRYADDVDKIYAYFVPMGGNSRHLYIRRVIRKGQNILINPEGVLVFNVQSNSAGIVKGDQMVEPVKFTVNASQML